jgi:thymidylate kinase
MVAAQLKMAKSNAGSDELHPVLRRLFRALESRGLRWTLLRVPSNPAAPTGDVDLLVDKEDAEALRELAAEAGFVALPGWGSAPDLILVSYDRPSDRWLILEVSTAISFRSPSSWQLSEGAEHVLRRRQRLGSMVVPASSDAFWLILLHCLLDKGFVTEHRRSELQRLAPLALESPLGVTVCVAAGPAFTRAIFVDAALSGAWEDLARMGRRLAVGLMWRRPVAERLQVLAAGVVRWVRKPFLIRRRRGLEIALLGPDGVGKSTAAKGLQQTFPFETRIVYMGLWKTATGLHGRISTVAEILARPVWIWSRYLLAQYHQLRGRLVIFDRYVYEALLPARPPLLFAKRPYFWLLAHALPAAGVAIVLDVPGDVAYGRKQENTPDELESERQIYARMSGRVPSLEIVDARADADTVRAEITEILWRKMVARWQGNP